MGYTIEIAPQMRIKQTRTILNPQDDLREIIDSDMGPDVAQLYDDVISELETEYAPEPGEDWEAISDGYRNRLVDVMNELQEIVMAKRINKDRLYKLWEGLHKDL